MALVTCPECHAQISDKSAACIKCGAPRPPAASIERNTPPPEPEGRRVWPWVLAAAVVGFFALGIFSKESPEDLAKRQARGAIELCWKDQQRKSLEPSLQRFIAGACEKMENDFREKYRANP